MNGDRTPGAINPAQQLARKLQDNKSSLHIGRIPDKTRKLFIEIANAEFCSDYGMLLKFLLDKVIDSDNKHIIEKLEEHEKRLVELEKDVEDGKNDNSPKTVSGKQLNFKEVK